MTTTITTSTKTTMSTTTRTKASPAAGATRADQRSAASAAKWLIGAASLATVLTGAAWLAGQQAEDVTQVSDALVSVEQSADTVAAVPMYQTADSTVVKSAGEMQAQAGTTADGRQAVLRRVQAPRRPVAVTRSSR